jgi:hypothetical protein
LLNTLHGRGWTLLSRKTYALHRIVADFQTIADDLVRFHPQSRELVEAMTPEMERRFEVEAERIIECVGLKCFRFRAYQNTAYRISTIPDYGGI